MRHGLGTGFSGGFGSGGFTVKLDHLKGISQTKLFNHLSLSHIQLDSKV